MIMRRLAVDVAWLFLFGLILLILLILLIIIITITSRGKMTRGNELLLFCFFMAPSRG